MHPKPISCIMSTFFVSAHSNILSSIFWNWSWILERYRCRLNCRASDCKDVLNCRCSAFCHICILLGNNILVWVRVLTTEEWTTEFQAFGVQWHPQPSVVRATMFIHRILQNSSTLSRMPQSFFWRSSVSLMPLGNVSKRGSVSFTYPTWPWPLVA